jgi:hypothetical protein
MNHAHQEENSTRTTQGLDDFAAGEERRSRRKTKQKKDEAEERRSRRKTKQKKDEAEERRSRRKTKQKEDETDSEGPKELQRNLAIATCSIMSKGSSLDTLTILLS